LNAIVATTHQEKEASAQQSLEQEAGLREHIANLKQAATEQIREIAHLRKEIADSQDRFESHLAAQQRKSTHRPDLSSVVNSLQE
jgi:chromosome segregation ATPase